MTDNLQQINIPGCPTIWITTPTDDPNRPFSIKYEIVKKDEKTGAYITTYEDVPDGVSKEAVAKGLLDKAVKYSGSDDQTSAFLTKTILQQIERAGGYDAFYKKMNDVYDSLNRDDPEKAIYGMVLKRASVMRDGQNPSLDERLQGLKDERKYQDSLKDQQTKLIDELYKERDRQIELDGKVRGAKILSTRLGNTLQGYTNDESNNNFIPPVERDYNFGDRVRAIGPKNIRETCEILKGFVAEIRAENKELRREYKEIREDISRQRAEIYIVNKGSLGVSGELENAKRVKPDTYQNMRYKNILEESQEKGIDTSKGVIYIDQKTNRPLLIMAQSADARDNAAPVRVYDLMDEMKKGRGISAIPFAYETQQKLTSFYAANRLHDQGYGIILKSNIHSTFWGNPWHEINIQKNADGTGLSFSLVTPELVSDPDNAEKIKQARLSSEGKVAVFKKRGQNLGAVESDPASEYEISLKQEFAQNSAMPEEPAPEVKVATSSPEPAPVNEGAQQTPTQTQPADPQITVTGRVLSPNEIKTEVAEEVIDVSDMSGDTIETPPAASTVMRGLPNQPASEAVPTETAKPAPQGRRNFGHSPNPKRQPTLKP